MVKLIGDTLIRIKCLRIFVRYVKRKFRSEKKSVLRRDIQLLMEQQELLMYSFLSTRLTDSDRHKQQILTAQPTLTPAENPPSLRENYLTYEQSLSELELIVPDTYKVWRSLQENGEKAYLTDMESNCAVDSRKDVEIYKKFASFYLKGTVLDIGCGPKKPAYLNDYTSSLIYGIDPMITETQDDFTFMRNIAEFLPWEDDSFDTIITGTSLDHILLLDRAINEMKRCLKPTGTLLCWIAVIKGSRKYDPYLPNIKPIDNYHLFHIDRPWFEELMADSGFDIIDHLNDIIGNHWYAFKHTLK